MRADDLGNLRDYDYDFSQIWFGEKVKEVRRSIAAKECHCPLANASYTNMLHDIPTLTRVGFKVITPNTGGGGFRDTGLSEDAIPLPMAKNE